MRHFFKFSIWATIFSLSLATQQTFAGYAPLQIPSTWQFTEATPAFKVEDPKQILGKFQVGLKVNVLEPHADTRHWVVEYPRIGASNIRALIAEPDLSVVHRYAFKQVTPIIDACAILKSQLEAEQPWPDTIDALSNRLFPAGCSKFDGTPEIPTLLVALSPEKDAMLWGMQALQASVDYRSPSKPTIVIELWNKGDAHHSSICGQAAYVQLKEHFIQLEKAFHTYQGPDARNKGVYSNITAVGNDTLNFFLPNDLKISLRYVTGEYLIIEISPFSASVRQSPAYNPHTFAADIAKRVKTNQDGYRYLSGIPMVTQGSKGYCAAATLARILKYYGYPVDMHSMADLANTEGRTGTHYENVTSSIRRVCNSTPFKIKQIKQVRRKQILAKIEQGIPIYWLIPGHACLIIGVHPEGGIVYSDSWGPGHEFKTMDWVEFINTNQEMWVLEPDC